MNDPATPQQLPAETRVIVSIGGMSLVGTIVSALSGSQVMVAFPGRTSPLPVDVRQVIGPVV